LTAYQKIDTAICHSKMMRRTLSASGSQTKPVDLPRGAGPQSGLVRECEPGSGASRLPDAFAA
jgi:hypothetical protein